MSTALKNIIPHLRNGLIRILAAVALVMTCSGCIHTYPDIRTEPEDPTMADIIVEVSLSDIPEWGNMSVTRTSYAPSRRIIIEILNDGNSVAREERTISSEEAKDSPIQTFPFTLKPDRYSLAVWTDLVNPSTGKPYGYRTSPLYDIRMLHAHGEHQPECEAAATLQDMDLSDWKRDDNPRKVEADLFIPTGRFRLVADDYELFLQQNSEAIRKGEKYIIEVNYESTIPEAYSLLEDTPMRPTERVSFSHPLDIITIPGIEMEIAADWLFTTSSPLSHTVSVTLLNSARDVVSKTEKISFPLERGKITTIHGDFLTRYLSGGVSIDTEWDGETDIEI